MDDTGTNGAPTNLISTGNLNANSLTQWGFDGAGNYKNFYAEGGYYSFTVDRKLALPEVDFDGWYAAVSWVTHRRTERYDPARAAFRSPNVLHPVGSPGVQGNHVDRNDHARLGRVGTRAALLDDGPR